MAERIRRPADERIAEIEKKIESHKASIQKLEEKKKMILYPKPRITKAGKIKAIMEKAKELDLTPEEIAEKLGITLDN